MKTFINSYVFNVQNAKRMCCSIMLVLLSMMFLFSCKQPKKKQVPPKNLTITLMADSNVYLKDGDTSITVLEGTKWRDIYDEVKDVIKGYKEGWEEGGFRLGDVDGDELERYSDYEFNTEVNIFAFAKRELVSIYIRVDEGYTLLQDNIKVGRFSLWKDIKDDVEALVELKEDYNKDCWKVSGDEIAIEEEMRFEASSTTLEAFSKIKDEKDPNKITLTVLANEGFDVATPNTLRCHKNDKWESIKNDAITFLTLKKDYVLIEWRKGGSDGDVLDDYDSFDSDEVAFAIAKKEECSLSVVSGKGYKVKDAKVFKVEKNTLWKDIKKDVEKKIEVLDSYEVFEWRQDSIYGDVLEDSHKFSIIDKIICLYPMTRLKVRKVEITIGANDGFDVEEDNVIEEPRSVKWKDIKKKVESKVKIKKGWVFSSWRLDSFHGIELYDNYEFEKNSSIFAIAFSKNAKIIVGVDEGYELLSTEPIIVPKGKKWKDVYKIAKDYVKLKEGYKKSDWKRGSVDGSVLKNSYRFDDDVTYIYATSKKT